MSCPAKSTNLIGSDPAKWRTNIPTFSKAAFEGVFPGIDVIYYSNRGQLEYDFVVHPGANPDTIRLAIAWHGHRARDSEGTKPFYIDAQGNLILKTSSGELRWLRPVVYQKTGGGRRKVDGAYFLTENGEIGMQVSDYDRAQPLIIDPVLVYSSYWGRGPDDEWAGALAVDALGNVYLGGETQPSLKLLSIDVCVTKVNPLCSAILYETIIGGTGAERPGTLAVDAAGSAYMMGRTTSDDFPVTPGALQPLRGGGEDLFVVKLSPTGAGFVYGTYLGGVANEREGSGSALDTEGNFYVAGLTWSPDFPTTPFAFQRFLAGQHDAFVAKLNAAGTGLVYSTYLGGAGPDAAWAGVAVDEAGSAYVAGQAFSFDFPTTPDSFQPACEPTSGSAFVAKLNPAGSGLVYCTYLGGTEEDGAAGIAVNAIGEVYVTGNTFSDDFPTTAGHFGGSVPRGVMSSW